MGKYKDLTGQIFKEIKAVSFDEEKSKEKHRGVWLCECLSCKKQFYQNTYLIQKGHRAEPCKCWYKISKRVIDETGKRYGRLTVISRTENNKHHRACWLCKCDCGNTTIVEGSLLRSGKTVSCGCKGKEFYLFTPKKKINEISNKYGLLTVLEEDTEKDSSSAWWKCQCRCGEIVSCRGSSLRAGYNLSCGKCAKHSTGEKVIRDFLMKRQIAFKEQFTFSDFRFPDTNGVPKYDFAIFSNGRLVLLIEYQGIQHYQQVEYFKEKLEDIQKRDRIKRQYCQKNNISLEEIPYTEFEKLEEILLQLLNKYSI